MKKIVFMGTPSIATKPLKALIDKSIYEIKVVTQPDKPFGRKRILKAPETKVLALENGLEVVQPLKLKDEFFEWISNYNPDLIITCAYGKILPQRVLDVAKYGCVNLHASLLPKLRGASPINQSIIENHSETGLTLMYMDSKMDEGDIIKQYPFKIRNEYNAENVYNLISELAYHCIYEDLHILFDGKTPSRKQNHEEATYCKKFVRADELIHWNKDSITVLKFIKGMNPFPSCYSVLDGKIIKIQDVQISDKVISPGAIFFDNKRMYVGTNDIALEVLNLKPEGKKSMDIASYLNGLKETKNLIFD